MWQCLFHYKIMTHRSVMIYYVVFMSTSGIVVSAVSDTNIYDCDSIHISSSELQRLSYPTYNVYKRCDVSWGQSLDITFDDVINSYRCRTYFYETDHMSEDNVYINQFTIPNINKISMSEIWVCQVKSQFIILNIYFEIKIKGVIPPPLIFVNRVTLIVKKNFETKHDVQYNYQNGDTVDVACINLVERCTGVMTYKNAEGYQNKNYTTMWDVGFQKKLQRKDNDMRIYCTSGCFYYETRVTVKFREQSESEMLDRMDENFDLGRQHRFDRFQTIGYMNVNINGHKVKGVLHRILQRYYINYALLNNDELLNIVCDASEHVGNVVKLSLSATCDNCEYRDPLKSISKYKTSLTIKPHQLSKIVFTVKQKNKILETVVIFFTQISTHVPNNNNIRPKKWNPLLVPHVTTPLTLPMTPTPSLVPPVTTPLASPATPTPSLVPPRTTPSTTTSVIQPSTTFSTLTANSHDNEHPDSSMILKIVGIVVTIILIAVVIVIYKLMIRDCRKKKNNENDENFINEDVIPSHPPQWNSEYAAPKDMIQNQTIYTEPYRPDSDPKDCQYAIIDIKEQTSTGIYGQVLKKSLRKKAIYGNIGNMADEPNYATIRADPIIRS